jgi:fibronectin-binding autotransporter adhesin
MSTLNKFLRSFGPAITRFLVLILAAGVCYARLSAQEYDASPKGRSVALRSSGFVRNSQPAEVKPAAVVNDNWNGGIGNWSVATNWSAGVPNNGGSNTYNVTIDSSGADEVTLDVNSTISALTLGGVSASSLLQNKSGVAETLNITGALTVNVSGVLIFGNGSTLTVGAGATNAGLLQFQTGSTVTVTGNLSNSGELDTSPNSEGGAASTLTLTGALINTGTFRVGASNLTADVVNVQSLINTGTTYIGSMATLNLTNQPNGITDIVAGSELEVAGTLDAGTANGLAHLGSIEGTLLLENGKSTTATPGGGTLTVSGSGLIEIENSKTALTVAGNLTNAAAVDVGSGSALTVVENLTNSAQVTNLGTLIVKGTFTNNAGDTLTVEAGSTAKFGTLVNDGLTSISGTLTLANSITDIVAGSDLEVAGTLNAGSASGLATLNSVEGTLLLENKQDNTVTPAGGTLTVSGSGVLNVTDAILTVVGNLTNSAQVTTSGLKVSGAFTNNAGATFSVSNVVSVGTLVNDGSIIVTGALDLTNQPNGITDVVAGSSLELGSNGRIMVGSNNGLANLTSVEGKLSLENGMTTAVTPAGGTLTVSSSGVLDLEHTATLIVAGNLTNSGQVYTTISSASGALTVNGIFTNNAGAILHVHEAGVVNIGILVNDGTVTINENGALNLTNQPNGITDVAAGSVLDVIGSLTAGSNNGLAKLTSVDGTLDVSNSTTVTPAGGALTVSSSGLLSVQLAEGGKPAVLTIAGNIDNSGQVEVLTASTVTLSGTLTNNAGAILRTGGAVENIGVANIGTLVNDGSVIIGANSTLNLTNQPNGVTDVTAGALLDVIGSITAGSNNGLAHLTSVEGTLHLRNSETTTATPSGGTLTVSGSGLLILGGNGPTKLTIAGNLNNSGQVQVLGPTTMTASAYNQAAGTTTVDGTLSGSEGINVTGGTILGAGKLTGNVTVGGSGTTPTINVGDSGVAGLLAITGTYTQLSTGTMNVSIGGTTLGTQFSQLQVSGAASLAGTLTAALVNGFTPTVGQTFTILTASGVTGTFTNSTIAINGSEHFVVSYTSTSVVLTVVSGTASKTSGITAASQTAIETRKRVIAVANSPMRIASLRQEISRLKLARPVWGTGLLPVPRWGEAHSGLIIDGEEIVRPQHMAPVFSRWERVPVESHREPRIVGVGTVSKNLSGYNNRVGPNEMPMASVSSGARVFTIRPEMPVSIWPTHSMMRSVR